MVYVLTEEQGAYSDWSCVVVGVFSTPELADAAVRRRAQTWCREPVRRETANPCACLAECWVEGKVDEDMYDRLDDEQQLALDEACGWNHDGRSWFLYPFEVDGKA